MTTGPITWREFERCAVSMMGSQGRAASAAAIRSAAWGRSWMSGRRIVVLDGNRRLRPRVTREYGHRVTRQMGGPQIGVDTPRTGSLLDSGRRRRACRYAWRPRSRPVRDQRRRRSPGGRSAGSPAREAAGAPGRKAAGHVGGGFRVTQPGYHSAGVQPRRAGPEVLRLIRIWTAQHYLPDPADRALAVAAGHQRIMT